jgi:hypothetical protein
MTNDSIHWTQAQPRDRDAKYFGSVLVIPWASHANPSIGASVVLEYSTYCATDGPTDTRHLDSPNYGRKRTEGTTCQPLCIKRVK